MAFAVNAVESKTPLFPLLEGIWGKTFPQFRLELLPWARDYAYNFLVDSPESARACAKRYARLVDEALVADTTRARGPGDSVLRAFVTNLPLKAEDGGPRSDFPIVIRAPPAPSPLDLCAFLSLSSLDVRRFSLFRSCRSLGESFTMPGTALSW